MATSHVFALYEQTKLSNDLTLQSIMLFSHNYVTTTIPYLSNNTKHILIEKYPVSNYPFEGLLNYHYPIKYDLALIPHIGLRYGLSRSSMNISRA